MKAALLSLVCFLFGALLPVVPWFIGEGTAPKVWSVAIGVIAAGFVGAAIGATAERGVPRTAARQIIILLVACGVTYLVGQLFDVTVA
jgi:VIT1/CCC1 family predicted Fe2+/Mn2+ transporter